MMDQENVSRAGFYAQPAPESSIKIRLDTSPILQEFELFLKGEALTVKYNDDGQAVQVVEKVGSRLMNNKGIQCCLMTLSQTINSQAVQGNWKAEYFEQFICEVDVNFSKNLMVNRYEWELSSLNDYDVICNSFINLLQQFQSRLIDNKERESYSTTMRMQENSVVQQQGGGSRLKSMFGG